MKEVKIELEDITSPLIKYNNFMQVCFSLLFYFMVFINGYCWGNDLPMHFEWYQILFCFFLLAYHEQQTAIHRLNIVVKSMNLVGEVSED